MSMSQEEIEALMNGLDIVDDEDTTSKEKLPEKEESSIVNTDEIEELISQNEEVEEVEDTKTEVSEESTPEEIVSSDDIDALLKDLDQEDDVEEEKVEINSIDDIEVDAVVNNNLTAESFDDLSADDEGIVESTKKTVDEEIKEDDNNNDKDEIGKDWADNKINEGIFPLPADNNTKVVNQLTQVANDSEEKVSQIFDVLSLTLDNNNELRTKIESFEKYIDSELELLNSLSTKFPNIEVFNIQKELANKMKDEIKDINYIANSEDMKIFEAMELMQFNDINRQKIERVMSVIRKLSSYLNNLFEDDGTSPEVVVAKHIHGDKDHDLIGEDLDKLIEEFKK